MMVRSSQSECDRDDQKTEQREGGDLVFERPLDRARQEEPDDDGERGRCERAAGLDGPAQGISEEGHEAKDEYRFPP